MASAGVKKNFTKFQVLSTIIPVDVIEEVKPLLEMMEADFTANDSYKQLKDEILNIFGPRPEDDMDRALSRVLTGKPSQLARALVNDLCKKKQLDCSCCPSKVLALWRRHLPANVKAGISQLKFTKDTWKATIQVADAIFMSNNPPASAPVFSVSAARVTGASAAPSPSLDETQPGIPYPIPEVNAASYSRGRGGRGRGNRGRGRGRGGGQASSQPSNTAATGGNRHKGPKHPDLPAGPWLGCALHQKWGRAAHFCSEPATCPWKDIFTPKPQK